MGEAAIIEMIQTAGPVAAGIGVVLLILFFGLKYSGFGAVFGDRKKLVSDDQIATLDAGIGGIKSQLEKVEQRLLMVETDVEKRATRDEMHALELAFARMEGRFESVATRVEATASGVNRIEEFMYEAALRAKGGK